jgi:hypothetical protein
MSNIVWLSADTLPCDGRQVKEFGHVPTDLPKMMRAADLPKMIGGK